VADLCFQLLPSFPPHIDAPDWGPERTCFEMKYSSPFHSFGAPYLRNTQLPEGDLESKQHPWLAVQVVCTPLATEASGRRPAVLRPPERQSPTLPRAVLGPSKLLFVKWEGTWDAHCCLSVERGPLGPALKFAWVSGIVGTRRGPC
jgi:hypothetical protein